MKYVPENRKESKRLLKRAIMDRIDIEIHPATITHGTPLEIEFYAKKWEETYQAVIASGYYNGYPEWWETTGYTREEIERMSMISEY